MKRFSKIDQAVLCSILLVFLGCAALRQLVQKPTITLEKTDLTNLSLTEGTILFHFNVENPNPIGINIQKVSYNLDLNQKSFIQGVLDKGLSVQANGSAPLEFPVKINFLEFFQSMQELFQSDQVQYALSGALSLGMFDVPYQAKGTLPVPKLPDISLETAKITRLSLSGAGLLFTLRLKNANPFSVSPDGLHYRIALAGIQFADGDAQKIQTVQGNGESVIQLPLNVSFIELGKSAYNLLTQSSAQYELSGDVKLDIPQLGSRQFPFQKSGKLSIVK